MVTGSEVVVVAPVASKLSKYSPELVLLLESVLKDGEVL